MDIDKRQDQTFTSWSNIYICDNKGGDLYLLGVNALVERRSLGCMPSQAELTSENWAVPEASGTAHFGGNVGEGDCLCNMIKK